MPSLSEYKAYLSRRGDSIGQTQKNNADMIGVKILPYRH